MVSIVDFIYHGEVSVEEEGLEEFMNIGKELQIIGQDSSHETSSIGQDKVLGQVKANQSKEKTFKAKKNSNRSLEKLQTGIEQSDETNISNKGKQEINVLVSEISETLVSEISKTKSKHSLKTLVELDDEINLMI